MGGGLLVHAEHHPIIIVVKQERGFRDLVGI